MRGNATICIFDAHKSFYEIILKCPSLNYRRTGKLEEKVYNGSEALKLQLQNKEYTPSPCLNLIRKGFLEKSICNFIPALCMKINYSPPYYTYKPQEQPALSGHSFNGVWDKFNYDCQFAYRNIEGYLVVTQEMLKFKTDAKMKKGNYWPIFIADAQCCHVATHSLRLPERIKLAWLCIHKYKKYVSARTIGHYFSNPR